MPTTCGYPNCKFRSRYRGSDDNRHFYRVPKKPQILRERWLEAIGRTEQTIVSQLRVCSGHFHGGEKREGDVPVADPNVDAPVKVELPPRNTKSAAERRNKRKMVAEKRVESPRSSTTSGGYVPLDTQSESSPFDSLHKPASNPSLSVGSSVQAQPAVTSNLNNNGPRPLVALLDGRDCSVEMPILKDCATVAFCDALTVQEVHEKVLNEAVAALTWSSIQLGAEELSRFKRLSLLVQIGPGCERIDLKAARNLGIAVSCISGSCIEETADSTLCLILNFYRKTFFLANNYVKDSNGAISVDRMCELAAGATRIRGQTLGLLGFGRIATAVAIRARAFGFNIIVYDPNLSEGLESSFGISRVHSVEELVTVSDCLSLHCSSNSSTQSIINDKVLKFVKKSGMFLVNTCSASIMDVNAVGEALRDGILRGVALDFTDPVVCDLENGPLKDCPNLVVTPGSSFFSLQSSTELREMAAEEIRRGVSGQIPESLKHVVNMDIGAKRVRRRSSSPGPRVCSSFTSLPAVSRVTNPLQTSMSNSNMHLNFGYLDSFSQRNFGSFVLPGSSFDSLHASPLSSVGPLHLDTFKKDIML